MEARGQGVFGKKNGKSSDRRQTTEDKRQKADDWG